MTRHEATVLVKELFQSLYDPTPLPNRLSLIALMVCNIADGIKSEVGYTALHDSYVVCKKERGL